MAKTRRAYTGASIETVTQSDLLASPGSYPATVAVTAATNWPYGSDPYYVVLSPGTASEEKILVTRTGASDTSVTIAASSDRGQDGTSAVFHGNGATIYPVFTAVDADEANELTSMWEAKGDIISHGTSTFARLAVGTNDYVLQADSSAASGLAWGQVDTASIANDAVTNAKIAAAAVDSAELAADAVNGTKIADNSIDSEHYVDGSIDRVHLAADIVDGTKIANDSINSEHYVDGSIDEAHIANNAITAAKIAAGAVGSSELASTGVTASTYGDANSVGTFTVDADGRLTSASNTDIAIAQSQVTNLVSDLAGKLGTSAKAADSEKLDNLDSTQFLRSDANDSMTGQLTMSGSEIRWTESGVTSINVRLVASSNSGRGKLELYNGSNQQDLQVADLFYGGNLNFTSSITLKQNVNDFVGATEIVDQLRPVTFEYKKQDDDRTHIGLIAEEVSEVLPMATSGSGAGMTINQNAILGLAIAGLKEANARISVLEARIAELESD